VDVVTVAHEKRNVVFWILRVHGLPLPVNERAIAHVFNPDFEALDALAAVGLLEVDDYVVVAGVAGPKNAEVACAHLAELGGGVVECGAVGELHVCLSSACGDNMPPGNIGVQQKHAAVKYYF
jgi:hypothetical protein